MSLRTTPDMSRSRGAEMPQRDMLSGATVLVVEDEALLALDLATTIEESGGHVEGPLHRLGQAMAHTDFEGLDAALLDVDIAGDEVFAFADRLAAARVPIVFHTARADVSYLGARYPDAGIISKPCLARGLVAALSSAIFPPRSGRRVAS